jgi:SulP family sulfate permease
MTLQAVDEITETPPSNFRNNQECIAQGIGNFVCGFFGAMGGDAMIGILFGVFSDIKPY